MKKCINCGGDIPDKDTACSKCLSLGKAGNGILLFLLGKAGNGIHLFLYGLIGIIILVVIIDLNSRKSFLGPIQESSRSVSSSDSSSSSSPVRPFSHEPVKKVELDIVKSSWKTGGFNTVAIWTVTFENKSNRPIGNIKYRTYYYSETDNLVDKGGVDSTIRDTAIQKIIKPHSKRTIEIPDGFVHREAYTAKFDIVDWEFIN